MQRPDLWFNVVPACGVALIIAIFFFACAKLWPDAIRRRDWGMTTALVGSHLVFGGLLLIAVFDTISSFLFG